MISCFVYMTLIDATFIFWIGFGCFYLACDQDICKIWKGKRGRKREEGEKRNSLVCRLVFILITVRWNLRSVENAKRKKWGVWKWTMIVLYFIIMMTYEDAHFKCRQGAFFCLNFSYFLMSSNTPVPHWPQCSLHAKLDREGLGKSHTGTMQGRSSQSRTSSLWYLVCKIFDFPNAKYFPSELPGFRYAKKSRKVSFLLTE